MIWWGWVCLGFTVGVAGMCFVTDYLIGRAETLHQRVLERERENWKAAYARYWEAKE